METGKIIGKFSKVLFITFLSIVFVGCSTEDDEITGYQSAGGSSTNGGSSSSGGTSTSSQQCAATTQKGTRCKRTASSGSIYCWQHK